MNSTSVNFHMSDGCRIEVAPLGDNWTLEFGDYPSRVTVFVTAEQLDGIRHAICMAQDEAAYAALEQACHEGVAGLKISHD